MTIARISPPVSEGTPASEGVSLSGGRLRQTASSRRPSTTIEGFFG